MDQYTLMLSNRCRIEARHVLASVLDQLNASRYGRIVLVTRPILLAPIPLELLMLAKTSGAILFGVVNAFVPVALAAFLVDLFGVEWWTLIPAVVLIAISSTLLGLFVAVSVSEIFEAETCSYFFRFSMLFLCGLFFPIKQLPVWLRPLSYALPLTCGVDVLHGCIHRPPQLPLGVDFGLLAAFCAVLFGVSLRNIRRKWIV